MRNLRPVPETPPRAIIYMRQSTYREESISLELQEIACRDYCARMGYDVVDVQSDPGISGRTWSKRPKVQQVMASIEAREADVIVLWKWSRLSRSRKDWAVAADRVDLAGGRIESATEPIDTATASGRFARGVMTEYAAFQSEQIGEQWEEVRQRRLSLGLPVSGRLPFGWTWGEGGKLESDPEKAAYVVEMYRRFLAGHGAGQIAKWLNSEGVLGPLGSPWTRARPLTVLDSPIHAGLIPYRGKAYPGAHKPIIDELTWRAYRAERERRAEGHVTVRRATYMLSQLVHCSCGATMAGKGAVTGGRWYGGYLCARGRTDVEHDAKAYVSALNLHPVIERWVMEFDVHGAAGERSSVSESRRQRLLRRVAELDEEAANVLRDRARGDAPAVVYARALEMIATERASAEKELSALDAAKRFHPDPEATDLMREDWKGWPPAERNLALRKLITSITLASDGRTVALVPRWAETAVILDI